MASVGDGHYEVWYELGAPVSKPWLKYFIAVLQYSIDNFFLIKNTVNAFQAFPQSDSSAVWVASCTVGLHILSSILISIIDSFNKDAISGVRGKALDGKRSRLAFFRTLAHVTLTMKLFRYTTTYLENRRKNEVLHLLRMRRTSLSKTEIQFIVDQKKNNLVESHYDLVESFFKTIPGALLQVYFMFETHPDARLRLFSTTDQDRFGTVFFTIITGSVAAANYQFSYMEFKKVLHFQDSFRTGFKYPMNLQIQGEISFITSIGAQIGTVGIRMCFYSIILFWSPKQFLLTIVLLLLFNWFLIFKWNKTTWRLRGVLENPLYGVPWLSFDLIDLWINLFVPGVHYPKPLDHFLNFYTTTFIGIFIFKGFDFLSPTSSSFLKEDSLNSTNATTGVQSYNLNVTGSGEVVDEETVYLIQMVIKYLMLIHDHLTLNQISYVHFFYNVVKYMNIVNLACLLYTFSMNLLSLYDLDFPLQIAHNFFLVLIQSLNKPSIPMIDGLFIQTRKIETFLLFFILPNSIFFKQFKILKYISWKSIDDEAFDRIMNLVKTVDQHNDNPSWLHRTSNTLNRWYKLLSQGLYSVGAKEINWQVLTDRKTVEESVETHPLKSHLLKLIDLMHEYGDTEDGKLLLAVFCANYDEIVRHYTSLRVKKMFQFMEIPVEKEDEPHPRARLSRTKKPFEIGYWNRFIKEIRGDVDQYQWD